MRIVIRADDVLAKFGLSAENLSTKARLEMSRGLHRGGEKMRTVVRKELRAQTSAKAPAVNKGTKSFLDGGGLTLVIQAKGRGLPIQDFPFRYTKSVGALVRWSPHGHWRLQERGERGRFGKLADTSKGGAGVRATMWGTRHAFKRSFGDPTKGPMMVREAGTRHVRTLFGPSLPQELVKGRTLIAFKNGVRSIVQLEIDRRLVKLLKA